MKDRNSQELTNNFDNEFSDNFDDTSHQNLLAFMKQNKPIAPLADANFEQRLFAEISKYPQRSPQQSVKLKRWLPMVLVIPTTIAAVVSFNWINGRTQYQMANNQFSDAEKQMIEQSLISSWNMTEDNVIQASLVVDSSTSRDTQILQDLSPLEYE